MQRSSTQSITVAAPPPAVLDLVGDPARLPDWAPAFAPAIRPDGDAWIVETAGGELRIVVRVSRELGTVDFLAAGLPPGVEVGAFARAVPNGAGTEFTFTQFFADGAGEDEVETQRAVVADELRTVRDLCQAATA